MTDLYDDIINLPHWEPKNHKRMPIEQRAAQFAPFAALTGHDEAIRETARLTDHMHEIDPETAKLLNARVNLLIQRINERPEIAVTYFEADGRKAGGSYAVHEGALRRIDEVDGLLMFVDGKVIPIAAITAIDSGIFPPPTI